MAMSQKAKRGYRNIPEYTKETKRKKKSHLVLYYVVYWREKEFHKRHDIRVDGMQMGDYVKAPDQ